MLTFWHLRFGRLNDRVRRDQQGTSAGSLFSRSLSPFRSLSPVRLAQNFLVSVPSWNVPVPMSSFGVSSQSADSLRVQGKDKFKRGCGRRSSNASSSEEEEDYSSGKLLRVKIQKQPSTPEACRDAKLSTTTRLSDNPPKVVTTSSSSANDIASSPVPNPGRITPVSAPEKRGGRAVFDTPIRPASALRRPESPLRRSMQAAGHTNVMDKLAQSPAYASPATTPTPATKHKGKDHVRGGRLFQAMSPLRLMRRERPPSANHAGTGRLLPADEDYYHTRNRTITQTWSPYASAYASGRAGRLPTENYSISDAKYSSRLAERRSQNLEQALARPRSALGSRAVVMDAPIRPVSPFRRGAPPSLAGTGDGAAAATTDSLASKAENTPGGDGGGRAIGDGASHAGSQPPQPPRPTDTSPFDQSSRAGPVDACKDVCTARPRERVTYQPMNARPACARDEFSGRSADRPKGPAAARPRAAAAK